VADPSARQLAALYKSASDAPSLVDVPPMRFLQLDGSGEVTGDGFDMAASALTLLAYQVKFAAKKQLAFAYKVPPLEAIYRPVDGLADLDPADRASSSWRLMIMIPDRITGELVESTREKVASNQNPPRLADVRVQTFSEGTAVQSLHLGSRTNMDAMLRRMFTFAERLGYDITGDHHEIYLGDPARGAAEKLKTVVRYGVRKVRG
jgi:hypothetical protein